MFVKLLIPLLLAVSPLTAGAADAWEEPVTGMAFVAIPKGCFQMGLPAATFRNVDEGLHARARTEMPQHEVCVDDFWIARHEVRESDWAKVMGVTRHAGADDVPVSGVTWEEAVEFARRLTAMSRGQARFRLPTEAEWEYACRAGAKAVTEVPERIQLEALAWFSSSYNREFSDIRLSGVQPVGKKMPNAYGLHDMLGNAWEWVQDVYRADAYATHSLYNPLTAGSGDKRVLRGGGLRTDRRLTRCEVRAWLPAGDAQDTTGLRLVREAGAPAQPDAPSDNKTSK